MYVLGIDKGYWSGALHQMEPTHIIIVIWVKDILTELTVEIYSSKSLVRAIGKVLLLKLS